MNKYVKEACVETLEQAVLAGKRGADRIEICARLDLGGITPSGELIIAAKETGIPVRVMIRPRGGNFVYNQTEIGEMKNSIDFCKAAAVEGVVFGIQKKDGSLNYEEIEHLVHYSRPLKVIIHKAIDEVEDPVDAVKKLTKIPGINSILTSGGMPTANEGLETLKKMLAISKGKIEIVVAGKVTGENIQQLHNQLNATAYHGKRIVGKL